MCAKILNEEIGELKLTDAFAVAFIKQFEERTLAKVVGNGTMKSGLVKLILGYLADRMGGKIGSWTATAFVVDGVEDIVNNLALGVNLGAEQREVI